MARRHYKSSRVCQPDSGVKALVESLPMVKIFYLVFYRKIIHFRLLEFVYRTPVTYLLRVKTFVSFHVTSGN